jgi:acrylyl-CoA reductase (NADPH)
MENTTFKAYQITEVEHGKFSSRIAELPINTLPQNGVLIRVAWSSLNYKDALSASGNKGVTRSYPHVPGIDASGTVVEDSSGQFKPGDEVIVTGYDLGMNTSGGFGGYINVPAGWVVPLPAGLSLKESMMLGTAGFTAALSMHHLIRCGQTPEQGPLLVTGASGGVGSLSVALASKLGFSVTASSGKPNKTDYLKKLGATSVIPRAETDDLSGRMLLRARWAGAIDTVGGNVLATVLKSVLPHGNIACCGNAGSPMLNTSVFPFILNGVNLLGINSATTPMALRQMLWERLAAEWKPDFTQTEIRVTGLNDLKLHIEKILKGKVSGRVIIEHS